MNKYEMRCWQILPLVSRSFALAIKMLPQPIKIQLNIAYLIYRIIDTIEDSSLTISKKRKHLNFLISVLEEKEYKPRKIKTLECKLKEVNCTYERILLDNLESVFRVFYFQPENIRKSITRWGKIMKNGMLKFQKKQITTLEDQRKYSYYVAGVVGYLFNELLYYNKIITKKTKNKISKYAKRFGIALQKINIIRDVKDDVKEKRYFWPINLLKKYSLDYQKLFEKENRAKALEILRIMIEDTKKDVFGALAYIKALPKNEIKVRIFCLIPLFMALESYGLILKDQSLFELEKKVKISRKEVYLIALKAALAANSNKIISKWLLTTISKNFALLPRLARQTKI
ncbi:MAG: squalene/phytoene synthase family protein [Candidatus Micrarchaeota archaeon]|nr:squalene/phytoene synthase family protein [Candidatus Micrarchaeota archaeon]